MHDILIIINIKGGIELSYDLITPIPRETHKMRYTLRMTTKVYGVSNFSKRGGEVMQVLPINPFHIRGYGLLGDDDGFISIGLMSTPKTIITKEVPRELPWISEPERGDVISMLGVDNQLGALHVRSGG
jgi:hypothetical protein